LINMLASRLKTKSYGPILADLRIAGGWDPVLSTCAFEAVVETFA